MKIINKISFIIVLMCSSIGNVQAKDVIEIFENNNTSILILKNSSNFEMLGYGGSIGTNADCVFFSKGKVYNNKFSGYLHDIDTSIVSYSVKETVKYEFKAVKVKDMVTIISSSTLDFCGINTIFEREYLKIPNKLLEKTEQAFIDLLEETKLQKNILEMLLTKQKNRVFFKSTLKQIEKTLKQKKDLKTYNKEFFQKMLPQKPIEKKTLTTYNNIAYYLQKAGVNKEAVYLLEKILEKFPKRMVAYYNLGDAYWALGDKKKAKKAYSTYIKMMKAKGKEKRIPKVVKQRVSNK